MTMDVARDSGAAMRRRQRRLRSWWRHEQQSIAAALATSQHHSAQRPKKARAGVWEHEMDYILFIKPDSEIKLVPNKEEVDDTRWVTKDELRERTT